MTSIRNAIPTELQIKYADLRKQSVDNIKNNIQSKNTVSDSNFNLQIDKVTLSTGQQDNGTTPKLKPSESVSQTEKQALQVQFSVYA